MTRDEALALYRPIRVSIRHVLGIAVRACGRADQMRAAKQLGIWSEEGIMADEDGEALNMMSDIALFEPNQRGRRAYERFLSAPAEPLDAPERALAERMGASWFSLFRCEGQHAAAGVWLRDLLERERRLWIMDEGMEASMPEDMVFGARLFDAGPFHAAFGIIVQPDAETIQLCVQTQASSGRAPFRHSLAATLYGDALRDGLFDDLDEEALLPALLEGLAALADGLGQKGRAPAAMPGQKRRRRS